MRRISETELRDGELFEGLALVELRLDRELLAGKQFYGCLFQRCRMSSLHTRRCLLDDVRIEDCDLSLCKLDQSSFRDVRFLRCKLSGLDWAEAHQLSLSVSFDDCVLDYSSFANMRLRGTRFLDCSAREVSFLRTDLRKVDFRGTDLLGARFERCDLRQADLSAATGYVIPPTSNRLEDTRFSMERAIEHLGFLGVVIG